MSDFILGIIILALLGVLCWVIAENNREKAKLVNALVAKTPEQFRDLNMTDKVEPISPAKTAGQSAEFVPMESLSDEEFDKHIKDQLQ